MGKVQSFYQHNINSIKKELDKLEKISILYGSIRMAIVVVALVGIYYFYRKNQLPALVWVAASAFILFGIAAFFHNEIINKREKVKLTLEYNEKGLKRIDGTWKDFEDNGEEFVDINHGFTSDLDIFGKNSLFQWINTTNTIFGRDDLAKKLKIKELPRKDQIEELQEAMKELSNKREFARDIYVESYHSKKDKGTIEDLLAWAKGKTEISKTVAYTPYLFLVSTFIFIFLFVTKRIPISIILLIFIINYLVVKLLTRNLSEVVPLFMKHKRKIIRYSQLLALIEDNEFESGKLLKIKKNLQRGKTSCKEEMKKLKNIINWIGDSQSNAYYIIINVIFLSDVFILKNLERWRAENGDYLEKWLKEMGEMEALVALSNLAFENEEWTYAVITKNKEVIGHEIGHPILANKAVVNDFNLGNIKDVALITGSNMSGKSTFLRTIGLNIVLTYLGLPTFSKGFKCGIFNIYTCMRTQDNLEESISSFYAEILRIKILIEATKRGEDVFFLLDEIFKGTNSVDRHTGAMVLIQQLVNGGAKGLVSTHDLELCDLEKEKDWLINFNFREYYENNKIMFDYKLRNGKSETQNAKHLMKLAGIHIS